jgi:hypothetical protein
MAGEASFAAREAWPPVAEVLIVLAAIAVVLATRGRSATTDI